MKFPKSKGNILLLWLILTALTLSCRDSDSPPPQFLVYAHGYTAFGNPELVNITGYNGDAMEPFISRDGSYLFFNNNKIGAPEKDISYATRVNETNFVSQGTITAVNSTAVDGVPTLDDADNFYFVSLVSFATNSVTLYKSTWNSSTVSNITSLSSLTLFSTSGFEFLYFDIEINPAGDTLYLSIGAFAPGSAFPSAADIAIAIDSGSGFAPLSNWQDIMANVNTTDNLEYAPTISRDGLELFFTRFNPATGNARIYRSVRPNTSSPFGKPQLVSAITGFVEGPAFSPDEKSLYYHRLNTGTNKYELYRVTRP